jgi:hypothetical protein
MYWSFCREYYFPFFLFYKYQISNNHFIIADSKILSQYCEQLNICEINNMKWQEINFEFSPSGQVQFVLNRPTFLD